MNAEAKRSREKCLTIDRRRSSKLTTVHGSAEADARSGEKLPTPWILSHLPDTMYCLPSLRWILLATHQGRNYGVGGPSMQRLPSFFSQLDHGEVLGVDGGMGFSARLELMRWPRGGGSHIYICTGRTKPWWTALARRSGRSSQQNPSGAEKTSPSTGVHPSVTSIRAWGNTGSGPACRWAGCGAGSVTERRWPPGPRWQW